jgi:hypothetical protein
VTVAGWELEDVEEAARAKPRSFFIPSLDERCAQSVGDEVRLHFVLTGEGPDLPRAERMWVDIVERTGEPPRYVGALTSQPAFITNLQIGERIPFGPQHIAQTVIKRSDPRWFEAAERDALVSRQVLDDGEAIRWMYREAVTRDADSGWRLFSGRETAEYLNDSANATLRNVGWLLDLDPTLLPAIRADIGSAFERESPSEPWVEVTDWKPPEE